MDMENRTLNAMCEVIAGELEHFHYQNGGSRLQPNLERSKNASELITYHVIDGESQASILLRPADNNQCILTVNYNDSERYAMKLGVPGRCELGTTAILGAAISDRCVTFCQQFLNHLEETKFTEIADQHDAKTNNGGRPYNPENQWAWEQVKRLGRNIKEILPEWLERRQEVGRDEPSDPLDSLKKTISSYQKKMGHK